MLTEKGPLEPRVVAEIGRQVADGLAAAHAAGVVHRDVKPGNVLIAEDGRVKLTDFGVSRAVDDVQLTRTGLIAGTPAFLSPEVARGQEPTAASDVFALGCHALRRRRGPPAVRARRQRLRAAAQGRHGHRGPAAAGRAAHRAADAAAVRRPEGAPDGVAGPRRARRDRRGPAPASGNPSTGTALLDVGAARGRRGVRPVRRSRTRRRSRWPPLPRCPRRRPRRSGRRRRCRRWRRRRGPRHGAASPAADRPGGGAGRRPRRARGGADQRRPTRVGLGRAHHQEAAAPAPAAPSGRHHDERGPDHGGRAQLRRRSRRRPARPRRPPSRRP